MEKNKGGRPRDKTRSTEEPVSTYEEIGIDRKEAHHAQRLSELPEEKKEARWQFCHNVGRNETAIFSSGKVANIIRRLSLAVCYFRRGNGRGAGLTPSTEAGVKAGQ